VLGQLAGVNDTGYPQRPPEGAAPLCQREASRIWMQVCTPARQSAGRIRPKNVISLTGNRNDPQ
jgi:hypothetical protein